MGLNIAMTSFKLCEHIIDKHACVHSITVASDVDGTHNIS